MRILKSKLNKNSSQFRENYQGMKALVEELEKHLESSRFQGKEKHIARAANEANC